MHTFNVAFAVSKTVDNTLRVHACRQNESTPLLRAARGGHTDTAKVLLAAKAQIEAQDKVREGGGRAERLRGVFRHRGGCKGE